MTATNRRQLLTGAVTYAAGVTIVAGGAALASEAHGATINPALAVLIAEADSLNEEGDRHHHEVFCRAVTPEARRIAAKENDSIGNAWIDKLNEVGNYPAASIADLRAKLAVMTRHDMGDGRDWLDTISKDVVRIAEARA